MNEKITTKTGQEMLDSVLPLYNKDDYSLSIFEANGRVMDEIRMVVEQTRDQMYPQKATWTLGYWEEMLGIGSRGRKADAERVQQVLFELNKYFSITRHRMETIINMHVENKDARVIEVDDEYAFSVEIPAKNYINGPKIREIIEEIKPAHLAYELVAEIVIEIIQVVDDTYSYPVFYKTCGEFSGEKDLTQFDIGEINLIDDTYSYPVEYPVSEKGFSQLDAEPIQALDDTYGYIKKFPITGGMEPLFKAVTVKEMASEINGDVYNLGVSYPICGEFHAEGDR